ncbi:uncharacterized protein LOC129593930 [Paramacrobiotus metropolitanus]|uniref:uncharacterized protein LOC129593930 n=1 Tax=Paramacrobiotus metropolitanus TaxID=2943436 RepID=UPI0024465470|nr:uncharacterized protein LOC129593930 [Paramacrobiotus metropolitanus]
MNFLYWLCFGLYVSVLLPVILGRTMPAAEDADDWETGSPDVSSGRRSQQKPSARKARPTFDDEERNVMQSNDEDDESAGYDDAYQRPAKKPAKKPYKPAPQKYEDDEYEEPKPKYKQPAAPQYAKKKTPAPYQEDNYDDDEADAYKPPAKKPAYKQPEEDTYQPKKSYPKSAAYGRNAAAQPKNTGYKKPTVAAYKKAGSEKPPSLIIEVIAYDPNRKTY